MRLSLNIASKGAGGRPLSVHHCDRDFATEKVSHIDTSKTHENILMYYHTDGTYTIRHGRGVDTDMGSFAEWEKSYYKQRYASYRERQNQKSRKARHPERCKSTEDMLKSPRTCPESICIQMGSQGHCISAQEYTLFAQMLIETIQGVYPHFHILDASVHMDERSPHLHIRGVHEYITDYGDVAIGKKESLRQDGALLPYDAPESTTNNLSMRFSGDLRKWSYDIARELDISLEPQRHTGKNDKTFQQVKYDYLCKDVKELTQTAIHLSEQIDIAYSEIDDTKVKLQAVNEEYELAQKKLDALKRIARDTEGLEGAIRLATLQKDSDRLKAILKAHPDLIHEREQALSLDL